MAPTPAAAAALAMGVQGVWTGSIWLTVEEAEASPEQLESYLSATSRDTVRSRSWTGQPCRMLRNAVDRGLGGGRRARAARHAAPGHARVRGDVARAPLQEPQRVAFNPVGPIVGAMKEKLPVREVIYNLVLQYVAWWAAGGLNPEA